MDVRFFCLELRFKNPRLSLAPFVNFLLLVYENVLEEAFEINPLSSFPIELPPLEFLRLCYAIPLDL